MSLNKIIIVFIIILIAFGAFMFYQFSKAGVPTSKATIGEHTFSINVAKTPEELQQGLSGRNSLPTDQGMLFVFEEASSYGFWMKGMKFPLDIIFINNDRIVSISKDVKPAEENNTNPPVYTPTQPVTRVLEINGGLSDEYGFKIGDQVKFELTGTENQK